MPKAEKHNIPGLTELKVLQENPKVALSQQNKEYNWKTDYDWTDPNDNPVDEATDTSGGSTPPPSSPPSRGSSGGGYGY